MCISNGCQGVPQDTKAPHPCPCVAPSLTNCIVMHPEVLDQLAIVIADEGPFGSVAVFPDQRIGLEVFGPS